MFCTNCGKEINSTEKFCTGCGLKASADISDPQLTVPNKKKEERWYHRLGMVVYVVAHLPLLIMVPVVWSENAEYYSSYSKSYYGSDAAAFWYSIITIVIWLAVLRLIKMALKYIVRGTKPKLNDILKF